MAVSADGWSGCGGLSSRAGVIIETASCEQWITESTKVINNNNK